MSKDNLKVDKLNSIYQESSQWKSIVVVTEWANGEGVDIQITSMNGGIQNLSITLSEFNLAKIAVKKLLSL